MRIAVVTASVALALGLLAGSASANVIIWKVSLSGSYQSNGSVTNQECGEDYKTPMTATAFESGTVQTKRATLFDAWHAGKKPELAIENDMKPMRLAGSITRTSGLEERDTPNGCNDPAQALDCSTKSFRSPGTLYGIPVRRRLKVAVGLDAGGSFDVAGGRWERCPLAMDQGAIPFWTNPKEPAEGLNATVRVPVGKLFAKHPRPFTVAGTLARSGTSDEGAASATWNYKFDFKLKFTFAGRA